MMKVYMKISVVLLLISGIILTNSCSNAEGGENKTVGADVKTERAVNVEVSTLKGSNYVDYINVIGILKPIDKASLGYQPGGIVEDIVKDKGQFVKKGETIIIIDNKALKAQMDAAEAQYKLTQVNFEKQEIIFKDKVNSELQLLESQYNRDQAKANYELIQSQYEDTFIKAPFSGIVDTKYFEEGELAPAGAVIVELMNNSKIKIETGVPERYVGKVKLGDNAKIYIKNVLDNYVEGRVTFVGSSVNKDNRTFPVEIVIDNSSGQLKPELVADVFIENGVYNDVFTIPDEVVNRVDEGYLVFVEENGIAVGKDIEIISRTEDKIAVKSGLSEGDNLITVGYQNLIQGQKVNVVN
ncbi:MAG: efflux RND transporter periplasmic adaptor subunit [Ignavibacteria bacterium]|jgi:RND family efflux transporter MFP subunit